jgi:hypothetical protein
MTGAGTLVDWLPLLLPHRQSDGVGRTDQYSSDFAAAVTAAGPFESRERVTFYALRHSGITHALMCNVPMTVVANQTDTSEREIRKHYTKYIDDHADALARRALLDFSAPAGDNVVSITGSGTQMANT